MNALLIFVGEQLSRGVRAAYGVPKTSFQFNFVFFSALLHIFIIVMCCLELGIRDPWTWYKGTSMRAQRAAYEGAEAGAAEETR